MSSKQARAARAGAALAATVAAVGLAAVALGRRASRDVGWIPLDDGGPADVPNPVPTPEPAPPELERTQTPLTDAHLAHLATFVTRAHGEMTERRPELGDTLVAGALAQGAAAHRLDPTAGVGVKDLDVWLFYARREGVRPVNPRSLAAVYDFGPSTLGRHPEDPAEFTGRRVDVLTRTIDADDVDAAEAVRRWLGSKNPSPQRLRERPVILLWPEGRCGEVVWAGPPR